MSDHSGTSIDAFGEDRAGFGMITGRHAVTEANIGLNTYEIRMGQFCNSRRRVVTLSVQGDHTSSYFRDATTHPGGADTPSEV